MWPSHNYRSGFFEKVTGELKLVPPDHPLVESARLVGTCFVD